jgi:hypothetical protein
LQQTANFINEFAIRLLFWGHRLFILLVCFMGTDKKFGLCEYKSNL